MGHIPIRMLHATLIMVFDSLTFSSQQQPIWQPYCKWGSLNKTLIDIGLPQVPYYTFVFSSVKLDICWASIHACDNRFETVKVFFDPCFMKSVKVNTCNQEHVNTTVETTKRNIKFLRNSYKLPCIPIKALKITLYYKRKLPNNIFHNKTNKIVDAVLTFLCGNTSVNNFLFFFVILMSPLKGM